MKTKPLVVTAFFVAIICILSPFSIYLGAIPLTLGSLAISLSAAILGSKKGVIAVLIYLLIGAVGVPVFAGFSGGAQVLFHHTGGFLWGYIPCAFSVGFGCERFSFKGHLPLFLTIGTLLCNLCGTLWFMVSANVGFFYALEVCFIAFLLTDFIKIVACSIFVPVLKKSIGKIL